MHFLKKIRIPFWEKLLIDSLAIERAKRNYPVFPKRVIVMPFLKPRTFYKKRLNLKRQWITSQRRQPCTLGVLLRDHGVKIKKEGDTNSSFFITSDEKKSSFMLEIS